MSRKNYTVTILIITNLFFAKAQESLYNIMDYGAQNNKEKISTHAIQQTIDACYQNGGGTVIIPAGEYLSGTIQLKSNINFHLEAGAIIYASRNEDDYDDFSIKVGAADLEEMEVLLLAINCTNTSVTGRGELNGQAVREAYQREAKFDSTEMITGREIANAAKYGADYRTKYRKVAPCPGLINFTGCTNVNIQGIKVVESSFWSVHLQWCQKVFIRSLQIYSDSNNGVNADGLDIDGCSDVIISDCIINTGDDALCLKTTKLHDKTMPCENVVINNCILTSSSAAFKIGTESHSDFRNIQVSNCIIKDANRGLNIILRDGGSVNNVHFSDITINNVRKACFWWGNGDPIWLIVYKRNQHVKSGTIENVSFTNINAHSQSGVRIEGIDNTIKNIDFNHVQIYMDHEDALDKRSKDAFSAFNVNDLSMHNCKVDWNESNPENVWQKAFNFDNIEKLYLYNIKGKQAPQSNVEAISLHNVQQAIIKDCIAPENTDIFISVTGNNTANIFDYGNFTRNAKKDWSISDEVNIDEILHFNQLNK